MPQNPSNPRSLPAATTQPRDLSPAGGAVALASASTSSQDPSTDPIATGTRFATVRRLLHRVIGSERIQDLISFQVSLLVHCLLLLVLGMMWIRETPRGAAVVVSAGPVDDVVLDTESALLDLPLNQSITTELPAEVALPEAPVEMPRTEPQPHSVQLQPTQLLQSLAPSDLLLRNQLPTGGGLGGRTAEARARLAAARGGTPESEAAVDLALRWLAAHQRQDGSWRLNHQTGPCRNQCRHPGQTVETPIGATGLALLPFLGAGYTHQQSEYRYVIDNGLKFLMQQMKESEQGGDLQWDSTRGMYAHGIATLALCEAYAMTGDQTLQPYAQLAVDFIEYAQHPAGGWRYRPQQPGDTTVTGWQVMALKSASLARLAVSDSVTDGVRSFLNRVQDGSGAFYGYTDPEKRKATTAIGLLLRMYLGWTRQDDRLLRGARFLAKRGPSKTDMYYNYYATQVLHHLETPEWPAWNEELRDYLVKRQATTGHERGSWYLPDRFGSVGGRHYTTAICAMTLQVYYRYLPLYGEDAVEDGF